MDTNLFKQNQGASHENNTLYFLFIRTLIMDIRDMYTKHRNVYILEQRVQGIDTFISRFIKCKICNTLMDLMNKI